ncbi:MAG: hypothetical protein A3B38_02495 [Candidatus Levybacteria bacterium RIFCSPLOWO2_01_FULL_36_13]|nr:MAG: hypothetical protein A2684_03690 [Candidatus Levybacteria bacterium RIFCSPHIGHO2_01_FULL_36_15b]OGH35153.1 MAG: hypothetical protein A3B38_02495 [Candidatus Levybacteria bacterium RIFCSPLOWO2_01_FULL_36_13]
MEEELVKSPEINESEFDVVVVLGGNIRKDNNGNWRTSSFEEGEEKSMGAHGRILAASELYKQGKAKNFIVCTGLSSNISGQPGVLEPQAPTEAEVMAWELEEYGVPKNLIIREDISDSTLANVREAARIIREHNFKNVGLLTSFWHLERAMVMMESQRLDTEGRHVTPLSSEDILAEKSSHHAYLINKVKEAPTMQKRIEAENRGLQAFKSGDYNQTPHGTNPTKD